MPSSTIYYVHDPMCSWCWGYRPVLDQLKSRLPESIEWKNLLGGLAPDSDVPMPDETREMVMNHWRKIQTKLGTEFNFDFWTKCKPRRSTYPACRAVIAAARQGSEEEMIDAIQRAYYLRAMNPSDTGTLTQLAAELGLDESRFSQDLADPGTHNELINDIQFSRSLGASRFPSLFLQHQGKALEIPLDYQDPGPTLSAIETAIRASAS